MNESASKSPGKPRVQLARRGEPPPRHASSRRTATAGRAASSHRRPIAASDHSLGRGDLAASFVIVFPLLLVYQLAIVVVPSVVASDPISRLLFAASGGRTGYLLVQAAIALAFLAWIRVSRRGGSLSLPVIAPVLLEAVAIAALLWLTLPLLVHKALGLGLGTSIASALGAGLYEELIFRLLAIWGALQILSALGLHRREATVIAVVIGAVAFAIAHHLGAAGEPFTVTAFCFRALAGLVLGAVFWFRSFAHAVYAHAAYDLIVLLAR